MSLLSSELTGGRLHSAITVLLLLTFINFHFFQFRFAGAARFDFDIQLGLVTCGHDTSHQFGERLLEHVEEHSANGWKDCVQCCCSHSWYVSRDMCRGSSLYWSGVLVKVFFAKSTDKLNMSQPGGHITTCSSSTDHLTKNQFSSV